MSYTYKIVDGQQVALSAQEISDLQARDAAWVPPSPPTPDDIYNRAMQSELLVKALILALNDGSFRPNLNLSIAQIRNIIKAKM